MYISDSWDSLICICCYIVNIDYVKFEKFSIKKKFELNNLLKIRTIIKQFQNIDITFIIILLVRDDKITFT